MGLILNGNAPSKMLYNGAEVSLYFNGSKIWPEDAPLPPNTVRVRTSDGNAPIKGSLTSYETATLVTGTTDVYDVYKSGTDFSYLLYYSTNVVEILGANTTNVTDMKYMFQQCSNLTTVPLFDTSNATDMAGMFSGCTSLSTIPLFDTSNVTNMKYMFSGCISLSTVPLFDTSNVTNMSRMFYFCQSLTSVPLLDTSKVTTMEWTFRQCYRVSSGALALYQQASTQANPPTNHAYTFYDCGRDTTTGAAELAQIPSDWK
jgi:surface protein